MAPKPSIKPRELPPLDSLEALIAAHEGLRRFVERMATDQTHWNEERVWLRAMIDQVLRGIAGGDFAVTLFRAAAFARIVATGRARLGQADHAETARMLTVAEQLEGAGLAELGGSLA